MLMDIVTQARILLFSVACIAGVWVVVKIYRKKPPIPFPPGPNFYHVMKGVFTTDPSQPWLLFMKWRKQYGDLLYFDAGPSLRVLVINSLPIAKELLEKRSSKYSSRPDSASLALYGWGFTTSLLGYTDRWRAHRRFHQHGYRPEAAFSWRPFQLQKAHTLLTNLLVSPHRMVDHVTTFTASTIMAVIYGYATLPHKDPMLDIINQSIKIFVQSTVTINIACYNIFPFLKHLPTWLPGLSFYRNAPISRDLARKMLDVPFDFVKKSMADGSARPSLVSEFLSRSQDSEGSEGSKLLDEEIIKEVAASGMTAGLETTSSTLTAFFMAMAIHPHVQERARTEIDQVVGRRRLPNFDDRDALPYIEAILRELYRWFPVAPNGAPHCTTDDDVYDGYFIPQNTLVLVNVWSVGHDESKFEDPLAFDPSRFLTSEGKLNDEDISYTFGFGRRICPGRHLADASLWIAIASVLATFQIRKARNERGEEINIVPGFVVGQVTRPAPFECEIVPRSPESEQLVRMLG